MNSNDTRQCQTTRAGRATLPRSLCLPRPTAARQGIPRPAAAARRQTALLLAAAVGLALWLAPAALAQPFQLQFPLAGQTPYTATITSVFDHSMTGSYHADQRVVAFTGEVGDTKPSSVTGTTYFGYGSATIPVFTVNGHYTGGGPGENATLYYDGHPGYDYSTGGQHLPVLAAATGVTADRGTCQGLVVLDHGNGYKTFYYHLDALDPSVTDGSDTYQVGKVVNAGTPVGTVGGRGCSGNATAFAVHLHFEVRLNDIPVDPYGWQSACPDPYTLAVNTYLWATAPPACNYSICPANRSHGAGAETGSITVAAGSGCAWTATPSAGWIATTSGGSGSGNGTVSYSLNANASTAARIGTIAVAGKVFAITQAGATPVTTGMALIPAGSFTMGDTFSEGYSWELPLHTVYVSAFYMDQYDVTKAEWDGVYQWAVGHGYAFDSAGSGMAANHPVQMVNWYDAVKWCNARSEMEGRTPAYYQGAAKTTVYRTGQVDIDNSSVNWNVGYRLPTDAEWERAARGGASGLRFPFGNTISANQATYNSTGTSPVGSFVPNAYGLYDMAGNVWQWCWDWFGDYSSSAQTDPRGPASGNARVYRGGSWGNDASSCRTALRRDFYPLNGSSYLGFRTVLAGSGGSQTQVSDITDGLVAYYPFDGNANDASGTDNHGVAHNISLTANRFGEPNTAYGFNGINSYVSAPDNPSLHLNKELTLSGWFLQTSVVPMSGYRIIDKETAGVGDGFFLFSSYDSGRRLGFGGGSACWFASSVDHDLNRWHHFTVTISQSGNYMYLDGIVVSSLPATDFPINNLPLHIGGPHVGCGGGCGLIEYFAGSMDDIRIYNRALSPTEVQQLYLGAGSLTASGPATVPPPTQVPPPTVPPRQPTESNLIVITHGYQWNGSLADVAWVDTMADAIRADLQRRGLNNWQVVPLKWTEAAWGIPATALAGARITGALYGAEFAQHQWQYIHLIGHSAGSVFIESFAKEIKAIWPATAIHSTFLDPYLSVNWGLGRETYGVNSDWADCYFAHDSLTGIFTEGTLANAHAVDVTWLDPAKHVTPRYCPAPAAPGSTSPYLVPCGEDVASSHGWPVDFYLATILGTAPAGAAGYGFPLSREAGGTANAVSHPVGNVPVVLGGPPPLPQGTLPLRSDAPFQFDLMSYAASDTGVTLFDRSGAGLYCAPAPPPPPNPSGPQFGTDPTGVPAWLAIGVTVTNRVNWVAFDAAFASTNTAEGLLTAYWNTNRLGTLDERVTDAGWHGYRFALPETVSSGLHVVGFRLDSFNGTRSSATVTNVALGYAGLTQPITLAMLPPASNTPPLLSLTAPAGFNYTVETSTNLLTWTPSALLVNTNGTVIFGDPVATNGNQRFYRASLQ